MAQCKQKHALGDRCLWNIAFFHGQNYYFVVGEGQGRNDHYNKKIYDPFNSISGLGIPFIKNLF